MAKIIPIEIHSHTRRDIGVDFGPLLAPGVTLTGTPSVSAGSFEVSDVRINSETFYDADSVNEIAEGEGVIFTLSKGDAIPGRVRQLIVESDMSDGGHEAVTVNVVVRD